MVTGGLGVHGGAALNHVGLEQEKDLETATILLQIMGGNSAVDQAALQELVTQALVQVSVYSKEIQSPFQQLAVPQADPILEAILITGGDNSDRTAELFLPRQGTTCQLPLLPDKRYGHVQSGNTLCGGDFTHRSCLQWRSQQGGWVTLPLTLTVERWASSAWKQDNSMVIMGGWNGGKGTTETVSSDGANTRVRRTFKIRHPTR